MNINKLYQIKFSFFQNAAALRLFITLLINSFLTILFEPNYKESVHSPAKRLLLTPVKNKPKKPP